MNRLLDSEDNTKDRLEKTKDRYDLKVSCWSFQLALITENNSLITRLTLRNGRNQSHLL